MATALEWPRERRQNCNEQNFLITECSISRNERCNGIGLMIISMTNAMHHTHPCVCAYVVLLRSNALALLLIDCLLTEVYN